MLRGPVTKRPWAKGALRGAIVSSVLLFLVGRSIDVEAVLGILAGANLYWFAIAVAMVPFQMVFGGMRWRRVSTDLGLSMAPRRAVAEYALSMGLNTVMAGGMAGDAVRVWRHRVGHGSLARPLRAAVVERVIGHWAHLAVTVVGLAVWPLVHGGVAPGVAWVMVPAIILGFCVLWSWPITGLATLVSDGRLALASLRQRVFHAVISLSLMGSILVGFWSASMALGLPLGFGVFTAVPLLMLVLVLPFSIGGWGLRELSAAVVFSVLGWSTESAVALSSAYGLSVMVGAMPALLVWFIPAQETQ